MPMFVIEREFAGAGRLPEPELQALAEKSCRALTSLGPQIQWVQSYVTDDKIYCIYDAPDETAIRRHAQKSGFPADVILPVRAVISRAGAEAA